MIQIEYNGSLRNKKMTPKTDQVKRESSRMGDSIAKGIESALIAFLTSLCRGFLVTTESIEKQKPGIRGNVPPPTGGISSLG